VRRQARARASTGIVVLVAVLLAGLSAPGAAAAFNPPSFVHQWAIGSVTPNTAVRGIDVDPFGDVYMVKVDGQTFRVLKFKPDGTPAPGQWNQPISGLAEGGLTTDAQGHVFVATVTGNAIGLLEFTSGGGLLATIPATRLFGGSLDIDAAGHIYANGTNASKHPAINEYAIAGGKSKLLASAPYPGTPSGSFYPENFLGLAVAPDGGVFANGPSTTTNFIGRFGPGLAGPLRYSEQCPASGTSCSAGFGVEVARSAVLSSLSEPTLYVAGGYGPPAPSSSFYRMGVYNLLADVPGGSATDYQGSFGPATFPKGTFGTPFDAAGSSCAARLFTLNSLFGGPGGTYDGVEVQVFDTHAFQTRCAQHPVATISGLQHRVRFLARAKAKVPCVPCAALNASGRFANARSAGAASKLASSARKRSRRRKRTGVKIRFTSSKAADAVFVLKRIRAHKHAKTVGGFVYPARQGGNAVLFTGVLPKHRPLRAGRYRVTVSAGANTKRFKLRVLRRHRKHHRHRR
jgi:hypothetical protein